MTGTSGGLTLMVCETGEKTARRGGRRGSGRPASAGTRVPVPRGGVRATQAGHDDHWVRRTELGCVTVQEIIFREPVVKAHELKVDEEHFALFMPTSGVFTIATGGDAARLGAAELALCTTPGPLAVSAQSADVEAAGLVLAIPDSIASSAPSRPLVPRLEVCDVAGPGVLLRDFLVEATTQARGLSASEADRTGEAALYLATAVVERHRQVTAQAGSLRRQHRLFTRISAHIDRNLGSSGLTPRRIAESHHISVRYLQRLFENNGSTPSRWIRRRRLENARRDLRDAALRSLPVREIGLRNGFVQPSEFSRAFRSEYGNPPGKFREEWFQDLRESRA